MSEIRYRLQIFTWAILVFLAAQYIGSIFGYSLNALLLALAIGGVSSIIFFGDYDK